VSSAHTAIAVADWRRRVFGIYAEVRILAQTDAAKAHEFWRGARDELFREHPQTPLLPEIRSGFTRLPVAPYDPAWRFELEVEAAPPTPTGETAHFDFETGTDGVVPFELIGRVTVPDGTNGNSATLDVWRLRSYGGGIFIPLRDSLAGAALGGTYGGGRYLLDTVKGAHLGEGSTPESLVLDFNFAYNPSCAYDPAWACPLAPLGNRLPFPVPVGELYGA
jgi:uncharacterized protein (DUF1684 family)